MEKRSSSSFDLVTLTSNKLTVKTPIQFDADKYFPVSKYQRLIYKTVALGKSAIAMASYCMRAVAIRSL
jgi:hypothetical protein